jgi:bifunctional UDP-N-acetylglucosamine pyrophosphorylase/glucosamine-1-phosphate N-acetyltransferase
MLKQEALRKELTVVILAAGVGSRMMSDIPKAMQIVGNFYLIEHLILKAKKLNPFKIVVVIYQGNLELEKIILSYGAEFVYQKERLGTANAVLAAKEFIQPKDGFVLILYVDTPLIDDYVLNVMVENISNNDVENKIVMGILAFEKTEKNTYGKILEKNGNAIKIIEDKDCNDLERKIKICNSGIVIFKQQYILEILEKINNNNKQNEYYLTDSVEIVNNMGKFCKLFIDDVKNLEGINTKLELMNVEGNFQNQKRQELMNKGVNFVDAKTVYLSLDTEIGKNTIVEPFVIILRNVKICDNVKVLGFSHLEGVEIKEGASVGPYARIRPNTIIGESSKIGNFVEIKQSNIGSKTKVNHLSYVGDSTIYNNVNVGAGVITCNYDGKNKHKTIIGENSFIGSNSALVAPVEIGKNSLIAAGSVITEDVLEGNLAIARSRQINKKRK